MGVVADSTDTPASDVANITGVSDGGGSAQPTAPPDMVRQANEMATRTFAVGGNGTGAPPGRPSDQPPQPQANSEKDLGAGITPDTPFLGGLAELGQAFNKGQAQARQQMPWASERLNPFNPIDWGKAFVQNDLYMPYQTARQLASAYEAFTNPDATGAAVRNIWDQQDAARQRGDFAILPDNDAVRWSTENILPMALYAGSHWVPGVGGAGTGGRLLDLGLSMAPSVIANMPQDPSQIGQALATLGPPALQQTPTGQQSPDWQSNVLWGIMSAAALAGTLLPGHRDFLGKFFPQGGPELADRLDQWLTKWRDNLSQSQDFDRPSRGIDEALLTPPHEGDVTVARAAQPAAVRRLTLEENPETGVMEDVTRRTEQKALNAVLKKLGITDVSDLYDRTWTGEQAKVIRQNWQTLKLPYDLIHLGGPDAILKDPRIQLPHLEGDALGAANEHLAHLHNYLDLIGRGPFWTQDFVNSLARSFLGIHRTLDATHEGYMQSALRLVSQGKTPEQVAESSLRIRRAIESATEEVPSEGEAAGAAAGGSGSAEPVPGAEPTGSARRSVYDSLTPEEKIVADSFRLVTANLRTEAKRAGLRESFVGNFFPHIPSKLPEKASEALKQGAQAAQAARAAGSHPLLNLERMQHRSEAISPGLFPTGEVTKQFGEEMPEVEQRLFQHQRFMNVEQANEAIRSQRQATIDRLLADPATAEGQAAFKTLDQDLQRNAHVRYIRSLLAGEKADPALAEKEAKAFTQGYLPLMETDFFRAAHQFLPRQAHAVHTQGLMNLLTNPGALMKITHPITGQEQVRQMAYRVANPAGEGGARRVVNSRGAQEALRLGYRAVDSPYLRDYVVHPELADFLDKVTGYKGPLANAPKVLQDAYGLGRRAIANIVALPPFHLMNVAGRVGSMAALHPIEFTKFVKQSEMGQYALRHPVQFFGKGGIFKAAKPWEEDMNDWALRNEARLAGVLPHTRASMFGSELMRSLGDATGESTFATPYLRSVEDAPDKVKRSGLQDLVGLGQSVRTGYDHMQNHFWGLINDFGTMAYHLEKKSALHAQGVDEAAHTANLQKLSELRDQLTSKDKNVRMAAKAGYQELSGTVADTEEKIANARLWAARRANSWMGHVAPEDWNPMLHEAARLLMFAPNWWRTWAELLTGGAGLYSHTGVNWTPSMRNHVIRSEMLTLLSIFGTQKVTGNALNYLTSGHSQADNLPGNQDRLEVTNPALVAAFKAAGLVPPDYQSANGQVDPLDKMTDQGLIPSTGGRLTIENPLGRQARDTEMALGLQSGQNGLQVASPVPLPGVTNARGKANIPLPPDFGAVTNGIARVAAARLSPLVQALAGIANIDIYRSAHDNQWRHVNPNMGIAGNVEGALMAPLYGLPGGQQLIYNMQRGQQEVPEGAGLGTAISRGLQNTIGNVPATMGHALLAMLTGVNPPFDYAPKGPGQAPSDDEYMKLKSVQDQFKNDMAQKSVEALSGAMTPAVWRQWYHDASAKHAAIVQNTFNGAPAYTQGVFNQVNDWESLYNKAMINGTLDPDKLSQLQAQWKASHTPQEYEQVQSEIRKSEQAYPMLKLYHQTVRDYRAWQSQYATQHGIDVTVLEKQAAAYASAYGDQRAQQKILAQNPELRQYERAKRLQFERSPQGLMYGLFYSSPAVTQFISTHHLSVQQLEQTELAAADRQAAQPQEANA